jgi:integrase/recombinase XerD
MNAGASPYAVPSPIEGSGTAWVLLGSWALSPARPTPIHPRHECRGFSALLVNIKAEEVFFEEQMILIAKAKGGKSRYVPILPELAQELRTHLGRRTGGYLFETNRTMRYSPRRIQQIIKETAEQAEITKRVYPHLLRHSVATTLLERGMPIEQIQKFLGHAKLETTQLYAESSTVMMQESYQRALGRS